MRINEAINYAMGKITVVTPEEWVERKRALEKEIKILFWPDSPSISRNANWRNLKKGATAKISPDWVNIMNEKCGVDANFLFGIESMPQIGVSVSTKSKNLTNGRKQENAKA